MGYDENYENMFKKKLRLWISEKDHLYHNSSFYKFYNLNYDIELEIKDLKK